MVLRDCSHHRDRFVAELYLLLSTLTRSNRPAHPSLLPLLAAVLCPHHARIPVRLEDQRLRYPTRLLRSHSRRDRIHLRQRNVRLPDCQARFKVHRHHQAPSEHLKHRPQAGLLSPRVAPRLHHLQPVPIRPAPQLRGGAAVLA